MEEDYFKDIKLFLDIFTEKLRQYNHEITQLCIKNELELSRLKLLKRLYNFYDDRLLKKKEENILFDLQTRKIDKRICKICLENTSQCIIQPCLHFCCCEECIEKMANNVCPICRAPFEEYLKIFF
jgi:hypothetical protein